MEKEQTIKRLTKIFELINEEELKELAEVLETILPEEKLKQKPEIRLKSGCAQANEEDPNEHISLFLKVSPIDENLPEQSHPEA